MIDFKKNYDPKEIEDRWYAFWEEKGYFKPSSDSEAPSFSIVIPPPNVTGSLHMGHALNATVQDILSRWKRMQGFRVLWLPGTDHAGIATQNVVERQISKDGIDRHKLGRDAFIQKVWEWKAEYGGRIIHQLKKMGASCDWSRERFTLDEGLSKAVREVFVKLFEEGLIYRDNRLINWCPRCHTALSDLEVEYEDLEGRLYYIKYPVSGTNEFIVVATTRPETMLGDTGVAVNPEDERYSGFAGKFLELPLTGRKIPVVYDQAVDSAFGTGAVKVTPAHDFNDEAMGKRHSLASLTVISEDGRMAAEAGERYAGIDRYECRKRIIHDLKELDLLEGEKKHPHAVGHCYRCKTIIEPLQTIQWYVKTRGLADDAVKSVEQGRTRLIPDSWNNNFYAWMRDINDWCISRQIWWGHRIPVWYCPDCKTDSGVQQGDIIEHVFFEPVSGRISGSYSELRKAGLPHDDIVANSKTIRVSKLVKPLCGKDDISECPSCKSRNIIRDPDVLDTWFSSALWPFSTLGWPEQTGDLKAFYPTSVLVTAFDILFFWVARMMMMGGKFMDDVPFKDVYIHALIRDAHGHKMSKSKGNVIDPLIMTDKYGADAFRFSLAAFAAQGRDIRFSEERVEGYRFFINKLWNATKFILNYSSDYKRKPLDQNKLDLSGRWIVSRLSFAADEVSRNLENYRFNDAAGSIYHFVWHEFCDWYIELSKPALYNGSEEEKEAVLCCMFHLLENTLKLLHPFMPFVTEEIWSLVFEGSGSIMVEKFPSNLPKVDDAERQMAYVLDAVNGIRSVRGELNVSPGLEIRADIKALSKEAEEVIKANLPPILKMTRSKEINVGMDVSRAKGSAIAVMNMIEIYIPMEGLLDIKAEVARIGKEQEKIAKDIMFINKKLSNEDFIKNAPPDVVAKDRSKYELLLQKKSKLDDNLNLLKTVEG
ncbi:MAG: valine--tRNA ligase [Nitrospirae bacterium]|nr:valine--tRNA ligase [Nitrospirota bacterium]